ncbi:winged helix-turn-helix transcriptional regulator [Sphingopyxis indica]|uniref:Transcriptional regulator, HxlR family n=1 Tax=Sphingopyxis indica TaxID=436663 RepID=A0A239HI71_9SPHN|nr:helix-turn-helix domain-containing protein [Sphingopyxis indica]SNS81022.1 transcriptional regulator, HxlR family [Sphingopyxis indica]
MPQAEKISFDPHPPVDPRVEMLVNELIGRVADKWTLLVLEELEDHGTCRFTELARLVPGISQKMLTQTLRAMERDGLVHRQVFAVVPPKVEYCLTDLGRSLGEAFCGVWHWAEAHLCEVEGARAAFDARGEGSKSSSVI